MKQPVEQRAIPIPPVPVPKSSGDADARRKEPNEVLGRHKNSGQKDHKGAR
jgi:hypothetical protein